MPAQANGLQSNDVVCAGWPFFESWIAAMLVQTPFVPFFPLCAFLRLGRETTISEEGVVQCISEEHQAQIAKV